MPCIEITSALPASISTLISSRSRKPMEREAILVRIDGDGANAELCSRAHDADRDLGPVGNE